MTKSLTAMEQLRFSLYQIELTKDSGSTKVNNLLQLQSWRRYQRSLRQLRSDLIADRKFISKRQARLCYLKFKLDCVETELETSKRKVAELESKVKTC